MIDPAPHRDPALAKLVEKQMRNWELARAQRPKAPAAPPEDRDFITISRMVGSGGGDVARRLGERLSWPVFDKQILQVMAGDDAIRRQLYESMDERDLGWFEETLRSLMQRPYARNDYFRKLSETILSLGRQGHTVFLGRAAHLILPGDAGLRIRLIAPLQHCVRNFARRFDVDEEQARETLGRVEKERTEFIERHFGAGASAAERHDVVINTARWFTQQIVDLIVEARALRRRDISQETAPGPQHGGIGG